MFTILFLLSWALFSSLMSIYVLGSWYIILWVILGYFVGVIGIVLGIIFHTLTTFPLSINSKYKNYGFRSAAYALSRFVFNLKIIVTGLENVPREGPLVIYTNHKSYLDPLLVIENIKRPTAFTPKSSLYKIPILRMVLKTLGCMPVYRDDNRKTAKALIESIKNVKNGFSMIVFPEGGRKNRDTDEVSKSLPGAYKLASKANANILPISINGSANIQHNAPFRKTTIKLVIHDLIKYEDYKEMHTSEIAEIVTNKINEGIIK
ncbi:MAG: lysophospholipid acyltransferase family protein [Acholeplasmataceae bacterium]